jgi:hypothetical protein
MTDLDYGTVLQQTSVEALVLETHASVWLYSTVSTIDLQYSTAIRVCG